jgi:integrase
MQAPFKIHDARLLTNCISKMVLKCSVAAGYDWVRFHDLRHFCGSFLANAGVEIQMIAEILGHKDLRSTRLYSHFSESSIKQAMSVFDKSDSVSKVSAGL